MIGGKGYDPEKNDYSDFEAWLQCYYVDGMKSVRDNNGRTIWFKVRNCSTAVAAHSANLVVFELGAHARLVSTHYSWNEKKRSVLICFLYDPWNFGICGKSFRKLLAIVDPRNRGIESEMFFILGRPWPLGSKR